MKEEILTPEDKSEIVQIVTEVAEHISMTTSPSPENYSSLVKSKIEEKNLDDKLELWLLNKGRNGFRVNGVRPYSECLPKFEDIEKSLLHSPSMDSKGFSAFKDYMTGKLDELSKESYIKEKRSKWDRIIGNRRAVTTEKGRSLLEKKAS